MNFSQIQEQAQNYILHSYGRVPVALDHGKGCEAWDVEGKHYYDFTSGIGVNALGYCDEGWVKAVSEQAGRIQHMSNYYYCDKNTQLAEALAKASGMRRSFFCNSGAEANECAIKIARKYGEKKGAHNIITLNNSFHGRTLTTLAATGQDVFHQLFTPLTEGFIYVDGNDIEALKAAADDSVCAVLLESVQGEGGVVPMDAEYLQAVRALCDERDMLFMFDEVQTGIGRTGSFFSYQGCGVLPDVVTTAKGLGGGLPIAVCMAGEKVKDIFAPGMNGSTFGANPIACAAALEVVSRVEKEEFLNEVREKGEYFREQLLKLPNVEFVRGRGLMIGIKVKDHDAHDVLDACAKAGLLILTAKELVRFLPPLTITKEEIDAGLKIFAEQIK
ncbi:MAG: aspartate aminotransferase family protein [Clostridia bacterium]|nr:aspartate aminotransferase family protein [Clostridia bacterium]